MLKFLKKMLPTDTLFNFIMFQLISINSYNEFEMKIEFSLEIQYFRIYSVY